MTVLEPDDARDSRDAAHGFRAVGDLTALVGDERQPGAPGDAAQLLDEALLRAAHQIVRQYQRGVRARLFGDPREAQGLCPAVADAGDDRQPPGGDLDGGRDDVPVLVLGQREELPRAAGGEEGSGCGGRLRREVVAVAVEVESGVGAEAGEREGQDSACHAFPQAGGDGCAVPSA